MGDSLVLRPAPDDPISRARGAFKHLFPGKTAAQLMDAFYREEAETEKRKWRQYSTRKR